MTSDTSAARITSGGGGRCVARRTVLPLAQEFEELEALTETTPHHRGALEHLPQDLGDLARPEEERAIELLLHLEDVAVGEMRVLDRGDLEAVLANELAGRVPQPAFSLGLIVEIGAGQRGGERHLDGVGIDLLDELDGFADRLLRLAGEADDEGAVHLDPQRVTVRGELAGPLDLHPLLDVVEDLLAPGLEAHGEQPEAVLL